MGEREVGLDPGPAVPTPAAARKLPTLLRRLLAPVLSALLAIAVAVPATWYVATRPAGGDGSPPPLPSTPAELRAQLRAQLPDHDARGVVLLEPSVDQEESAAFPPGRYRVDLICGVMSRRADRIWEPVLLLRTPDAGFRIALPCPSTPLSMPEPLDFTASEAGAVSIYQESMEGRRAHVLLVQLVPVTPDGQVADG